MKKFIFIIILLALIVAGCIWESIYMNKTFDSFSTDLVVISNELNKTPDAIATEENLNSIKVLHEKWHTQLHVLKIVVWHNAVKEIEIGLARIEAYILENNNTEAQVEINNLKNFIKHYAKDFEVSIENIF